MKLLFVHQNLPAQFKHLLRYYGERADCEVVAICQPYAPAMGAESPYRDLVKPYKPHRKPAEGIHNYVYSFEQGVLNGQAVAARVLELAKEGFTPDLMITHTGWGEGLYLKDVYPDVPLIGFFEFFYHARGMDADFDPEFPLSKDAELRVRTRNGLLLLGAESCDLGISPTQWQKSVHPAAYQDKISVIHEGIDTQAIAPDPAATFTLPDGRTLGKGDEVVTYVSRSLEPYRGFHVFMRALPDILSRQKNCNVVIVGGDQQSYGRSLPNGQTWREKMLDEVEIDRSRVHFVGLLPWEQHISLLKVSAVHVYLTVPFVLSWSMLEAMSAGCAVVGSNTPPVREVIQHGRNGLLVDFFSKDELVSAVSDVLRSPAQQASLGKNARSTIVAKYDVTKALAAYDKLFRQVVSGTTRKDASAG